MSPLLPARHILLADDDKDDQLLFKEALEEIPLSTSLTIVQNGEQLMQSLNDKRKELPDVLFLDLNMPRKNGFTCLSEIKQSERLKQFPVIIFTTSYDSEIVNLLYKKGAHYYIRKPNNFENLKKAVNKALTLTEQKNKPQPSRENFVLPQGIIKDEVR